MIKNINIPKTNIKETIDFVNEFQNQFFSFLKNKYKKITQIDLPLICNMEDQLDFQLLKKDQLILTVHEILIYMKLFKIMMHE